MLFDGPVLTHLEEAAAARGISVPEVIEAGVKTMLGAGTPPPVVFVVTPNEMSHVRQMVANGFNDADIVAWVKIPALAVAAIRKELG